MFCLEVTPNEVNLMWASVHLCYIVHRLVLVKRTFKEKESDRHAAAYRKAAIRRYQLVTEVPEAFPSSETTLKDPLILAASSERIRRCVGGPARAPNCMMAVPVISISKNPPAELLPRYICRHFRSHGQDAGGLH